MILLQIVMVSPGTHLVKNHELLSVTNESQLKKTRNPKLKMVTRQMPKLFIIQFTDIKV